MTDSLPIHLVAECRAKPGQADALRTVLHAAVAPSRQDDGVLSYHLHEDTKQPGHFFFVENYASHDALKQHMQQPHFKALVAGSKDLLDGEFKMAIVRPVE